jgi:hypothetical protein
MYKYFFKHPKNIYIKHHFTCPKLVSQCTNAREHTLQKVSKGSRAHWGKHCTLPEGQGWTESFVSLSAQKAAMAVTRDESVGADKPYLLSSSD